MVKFRNDTDEEMCGEVVPGSDEDPKYKDYGGIACARTKGHEGDHIGLMRDAANADGVCHACREPLTGEHRDDCFLLRDEDEETEDS